MGKDACIKPADLSLIPGIHVLEGEARCPELSSDLPCMLSVVQATLPINKLINEHCWFSARSCVSRDTLQCRLRAQGRMCWVPFPNLIAEYGPSPPLLCKSATIVAGSFQRFSANLPRDSPWGPEGLSGKPLKLSAAPPSCLSWFAPLILSFYSCTVLSMLFSNTVWSESGIREAGG